MFVTPAKILHAVTGSHVRSLTGWPQRSVQGSRRNALVACTALAERRRELAEVEEYLADRAVARATTLEVRIRPA